MRFLIKQTLILPLLFFIPVFLSGYLVDGYNPISQHASEITLTKFETAKEILNIGAILTGLSCILFSFGTLLLSYKRLFLSSVLIFIFGISMISNGLFPMGNPMHGFYGIGLSLIMLPFICCYEMKNVIKEKRFFRLSIFSGIIIFIYFWSMLIGLDPENYRGLTQRLASVVIFGWIAYAAHAINKNSIEVSTIAN